MAGIQHVVLVRWRADTPPEVEQEARRLVRSFTSVIPGVISVTEGPSVSTEGLESGFTWGFVIAMESARALELYLPHPEHRKLGALIGEHHEALTVYDVAAA
jgi:hypothetical protein